MNSKDLFYGIGGIDEDLIVLAEKQSVAHGISKKWKIVASVAACFAAVIAIGGIFGGNLSGKNYTVDLNDGGKYVFRETTASSAVFDFDLPANRRALSDEELASVFPLAGGEISGYCYFDDNDGKPVRFEGEIDDLQVIIAAKGMPLCDTVIEGSPALTEINGASVSIGYFMTDPNSKDMQNAVFYSMFESGVYAVYLEGAVDRTEADSLARSVAETTWAIVKNGLDAFAAITL